MSSSASKKRKPNDDSETIEQSIEKKIKKYIERQFIEDKIKKKLPDEIQRKINLTQQFPHRIRSTKSLFVPEIDCGEFTISITRIENFKFRIYMESYATYGIKTELKGAEKENFNTVLGNICRTIDQGLFNKTLELWNYGIITYDWQRVNSPFAGRSGPKRRLDISFSDTKGLPWRNCSWIFKPWPVENFPQNLLQKIQDLLEKNIKFSILKKYNEMTRNTLELTKTETLPKRLRHTSRRANFMGKRFHFKICKPKSSLRELIKKRLEKEAKRKVIKF